MSFNNLLKFGRLPLPDKILLIEALSWMIIAKVVISTVPMSRYSAFLLGTMIKEDPENPPDEKQRKHIESVTRAVNISSKKMPWDKKCYAQAVTAKKMLKRLGIKSTLYLGVRKNPEDALEAHAWLLCGDVYVTGGNDCHNNYNVVGRFT